MNLDVNGDRIDVADDLSLADLVAAIIDTGVGRGGGRVDTGLDDPPRGVAVAVDGTVVPRSRWASTTLADGQRVEVLNAVQGG